MCFSLLKILHILFLLFGFLLDFVKKDTLIRNWAYEEFHAKKKHLILFNEAIILRFLS